MVSAPFTTRLWKPHDPLQDRVLLQGLQDEDHQTAYVAIIEAMLDGKLRALLGDLLRRNTNGAVLRSKSGTACVPPSVHGIAAEADGRNRLTTLLVLLQCLSGKSPFAPALRTASAKIMRVLQEVPAPTVTSPALGEAQRLKGIALWMQRLEREKSLGLRDQPKPEEHKM